MNSNEAFEKFSQKFYEKYGYLPLGKSDVLRPNVEKVLGDLGATFCELLENKESAKLEAPLEENARPTKQSEQICSDCAVAPRCVLNKEVALIKGCVLIYE